MGLRVVMRDKDVCPVQCVIVFFWDVAQSSAFIVPNNCGNVWHGWALHDFRKTWMRNLIMGLVCWFVFILENMLLVF